MSKKIALRPSRHVSTRSYQRHMFDIHIDGIPGVAYPIGKVLEELKAVRQHFKERGDGHVADEH